MEIMTELDRLGQMFESSILTFLRVEVTFIPDYAEWDVIILYFSCLMVMMI